MTRRVLSELFTIHHPGDFLHEVLVFCELDAQSADGLVVNRAYDIALRLYQGRLDGFLGNAAETGTHPDVGMLAGRSGHNDGVLPDHEGHRQLIRQGASIPRSAMAGPPAARNA